MTWEDIIKIGYIPSDARKRSAPTINWMDAFSKYGFDDGYENTGQTEEIAEYLRKHDYEVKVLTGGHNTYIRSVISTKEDGDEIHFSVGGRSPERQDFSHELLKLLDGKYGKSMKSEGIKS